jgi:prepilin-type N-terminal cleavage/methylation domain-containing protein
MLLKEQLTYARTGRLPTQIRENFTIRSSSLAGPNQRRAAFTLVEVMVGVAVMAVMITALYGGLTFAFGEIRLARENVRATQILQEKMEIARLYNWDQINQSGFVPTTFTESYYAVNPTNAPSGNFSYSGQVWITNAPITESYSNDLRMVQIQVSWKSGNVIRKRQMATFVSQYGLQKYVY